MLAIYYVDESAPFNTVVFETKCNGEHHIFIEEIKTLGLPIPYADVVLIENDKVIDQFNFHIWNKNNLLVGNR